MKKFYRNFKNICTQRREVAKNYSEKLTVKKRRKRKEIIILSDFNFKKYFSFLFFFATSRLCVKLFFANVKLNYAFASFSSSLFCTVLKIKNPITKKTVSVKTEFRMFPVCSVTNPKTEVPITVPILSVTS